MTLLGVIQRLGIAALTIVLSACAIQIPTDPDGTLDQVSGGHLRVGVTENPPWVVLPDTRRSDDAPTGTEPDLVEQFASSLDADVVWRTGSEAALVRALERGELDLVIGGFDDQTVWTQLAAMTLPYAESTGPDGTAKHVMLVRMGENGFLTTLEKFLLETGAS